MYNQPWTTARNGYHLYKYTWTDRRINYNHATSRLAICLNETSQSQKHKLSSILLLSRCMTNYMEACSFLNAHFTETTEKVDNLFEKKLMVNSSFIRKTYVEKTYVVGTHWNCLTVPTTYATENKKKTILKFTFIPSIISIVFASSKHLKLPISIKMSVIILQIVYVCMTATALNSSS